MINYISSNLSVSIYQFNYTELNSITTKSYLWNGGLIVFAAFYNYTDIDFTTLELTDGNGDVIVHAAGTHSKCYTVAFSGSNAGQPLYNLQLVNLTSIQFNWNSITANNGSLMVKVYYI